MELQPAIAAVRRRGRSLARRHDARSSFRRNRVPSGRRELGHLHRTFADLPFPRRVRDELVAGGRARPHHVLPESGCGDGADADSL